MRGVVGGLRDRHVGSSISSKRHQIRRRYRRIASGANTATITIIQITESITGSATGPPSISPRAASITDVTGDAFTNACSQTGLLPPGPPSITPRAASIPDVTGFAFTNACSQPGIVSTGANAELANVSGRMIMN